MATQPQTPDSSLNALNESHILEQLLGGNFEKLDNSEYIYQLISLLQDENETFSNFEILESIALGVAKVSDENEKNRERLRLQNHLKIVVFKALVNEQKRIEHNIQKLEIAKTNAISEAKNKRSYRDQISDIERDDSLSKEEKKEKKRIAKKAMEKKVRAKYADLFSSIDAQKTLLGFLKEVPSYLKTFIDQEAERKETVIRQQEATNRAVLESFEKEEADKQAAAKEKADKEAQDRKEEADKQAAIAAAAKAKADKEAQDRKAEADKQAAIDEHKRKYEDSKNGKLSPEAMVVKPVSEIKTAADYSLAESKWNFVVNTHGVKPQASVPDVLYWKNKDGSLSTNAITDPDTLLEYWKFIDLAETGTELHDAFVHDYNNIVLDIFNVSDADLDVYLENEATVFLDTFLRSIVADKGYTGLLMVILGVNTAQEAIQKIAGELKTRAIRQKDAYEKLQPKNWQAKPVGELKTQDDIKEAKEKWRHVVAQDGNVPNNVGDDVYWVDSDGIISADPITDQATLDSYWEYRKFWKKHPAMVIALEAGIKNIRIDYSDKSDAELEELITKRAQYVWENFSEKKDKKNGDFGLMMYVLEAKSDADAVEKMKDLIKKEIERRKELDKKRPRVKAELVAVNVEQKLHRVAEMLADERLDQEIKENSYNLHGLKEIVRLDKIAYTTMMRLTREGVREKYVEQFMKRLKSDEKMRAELLQLDREKVRNGTWNHIRQFLPRICLMLRWRKVLRRLP